MPYGIPNRASDAGPEAQELSARDYIDLAIEALELAKRFMLDPTDAVGDLEIADGYIQDAQRVLAKEGK